MRVSLGFRRISESRRAQKDATRHHPQSGQKVAVLSRNLDFLSKSTKFITKKHTKKIKKHDFWYPTFFFPFREQERKKIRIRETILMPLKPSDWHIMGLKSAKNVEKK